MTGWLKGIRWDWRIVAIFIFAVGIRIWSIDNPLLDQHAWRQSSSGVVARNYLKDMNLFHPRVDMLQPGYPSAFGFYEYYVALIAKVVGYSDKVGRLFTLFLFLMGFIYFYLLSKRFWGKNAALWSCAFYAFLPTSAYYSRSFQPDSGMVSMTIVFFYYFTRWAETGTTRDYILSILSAFFMLSLKIVSLYMFIPATVYLYMQRQWSFLRDFRYYFLAAAASALPLLYHLLVPILSDGFYTSAFFAQDKWGDSNILYTFDFWRKAFLPWGNLWEYHYMHTGYILLVFGLFRRVTDRRQWVFYAWLGAVCLFFISAAYGMHHEYYSLPLMPVACLFIGRFLADFYGKYRWVPGQRVRHGLVSFMVLYAFVFSLIRLHDLCDISSNAQYIPMAKVIRRCSSPGDLVLYSTRGLEELQYLAERKGYHVGSPMVPAVEHLKEGQDIGWEIYGVPRGAKIRVFAIADYDLAGNAPTFYERLKQRFKLVYERKNEYIYVIPPENLTI